MDRKEIPIEYKTGEPMVISEYQTETGKTRYAVCSASDGYRWGTGKTAKEACHSAMTRFTHPISVNYDHE